MSDEHGGINIYIQIAVMIITTYWAIYTFYYKEIYLPGKTPLHINLKVNLDKVEELDKEITSIKKDVIAIQAQFSATNSSTRKIELLAPVWVAYGHQYVDHEFDKENSFQKFANNELGKQNVLIERVGESSKRFVVATGTLFNDLGLMPGESISRTVVFHVAKGSYDFLNVHGVVPFADDKRGHNIKWELDDSESLYGCYYYMAHGKPDKPDKCKDKDKITEKHSHRTDKDKVHHWSRAMHSIHL
jgi:hypothetical protein